MGLVMHCGGKVVTKEQVLAVPVPRATYSWKPVPYGDAINYVKEQVSAKLHYPIKSETYGLNKNGDQLFSLLTLDTGDPAMGLSIGLRQSYNKTLALGVAVGSQVFVCDNLCFRGDAFMVVRKNTLNVWRDFQQMVVTQVNQSEIHHNNLLEDMRVLKSKPCNQRRGMAILGVAMGEEMLTPTQATTAFAEWRLPSHQEFQERTLWSLYNAMTEGLKKGAPARLIDRHAVSHAFLMEMATKAAG